MKVAGSSPLPDNVALALHRRLFIQLATFILLELTFIALAIICFRAPLPCSISSSPTLTKAIFTTFFIIWQMIANTCAGSVVNHGFSSEWYTRFQKTKTLIPGYTDEVSTATAGYLDRFRHLFDHDCTLSYRLSFITSLMLIALFGLAPSSINVENIQRFRPSAVSITNFTMVGGDIDGALNNPIIRPDLVAELELQENTTFKFITEEHVIVGWPNIEAGQLTGDIKFESDVLLYNMTCWWEAPSFNMSLWNTTIYAGGFAWYPWTTPEPDTKYDGGLMPMFRFSTDQEFLPNDFPDPVHAVQPVGLQGYVFFGSNSSFPRVSSKHRNLNFDNLPTIFNSSGFHFIDYSGADGHFKSPLATFLLCDPHAHILDGKALLSQENTSVTLLSSSPPVNKRPKVGNISPDAANVVLGLCMMEVLEFDDDTAPLRMGNLASQAFTNDTSQALDKSRNNPFDFGMLPIDQIQKNVDLFMNSAGKALSSYIKDYDIEGTDQLFLMPVQGAIQQDEEALVTSRGLMIATASIFLCTVVLLAINFSYLHVWQSPPFKLETLKNEIERDEKNMSHFQDTPNPNHLTRRGLLLRLLGFIILEFAFMAVILSCSQTPILVKIPLSLDEVKGGFNVIFILWQNLAGSVLSDVTLFAFSSEWWSQYTKTGQLTPGVTDRVSRATSGNDDKMRYFFTRHPSIMFRCAFITSVLLTVLGSTAPSSLAISKVTIAVNMTMKVGDLRLVTTSQSDDNDNNFNFLQDRADNFVELEHHEDSVVRYDMESNWLMAWPDQTSIDTSVVGNLEYPTDVIHYNYSCNWRVPEMGSNDDDATTWNIDGHEWTLWGDPISDFPYVGGVVSLYRYVDIQPDPLVVMLVVGTNDTLPIDPDEKKRSVVNMNNLPTLYHPHGLTLNNSDGTPSQWLSPLSSVLVCDPRIEVSGGRARLTPNQQLSVVASQLTPVGNIPHNAITTIFSTALPQAVDSDDETLNPWIGVLGGRLVLANSSFTNFEAFPHGVPVHDIATLNYNLNSFTSSGSKAFLDGLYVDPSDQSNITIQTTSVIGLVEIEKQALVGDTTLGIVSLCLAAGSVISFAALAYLIVANGGKTFELRNLLPIFLAKGSTLGSGPLMCVE